MLYAPRKNTAETELTGKITIAKQNLTEPEAHAGIRFDAGFGLFQSSTRIEDPPAASCSPPEADSP